MNFELVKPHTIARRTFVLAWAATLILAAMDVPCWAQDAATPQFPGIGKPQVLAKVDEAWHQGSWWDLAFTSDNKRLVGSLVRRDGPRC